MPAAAPRPAARDDAHLLALRQQGFDHRHADRSTAVDDVQLARGAHRAADRRQQRGAGLRQGGLDATDEQDHADGDQPERPDEVAEGVDRAAQLPAGGLGHGGRDRAHCPYHVDVQQHRGSLIPGSLMHLSINFVTAAAGVSESAVLYAATIGILMAAALIVDCSAMSLVQGEVDYAVSARNRSTAVTRRSTPGC